MNIEKWIDDIEVKEVTALVATPSALRITLKKTFSAKMVCRALMDSTNLGKDIQEYLQKLGEDFVPGKRFHHEAELSLLAVVLEEYKNDSASQFLQDLASVHVAEMPMSPRVAEECLLQRKKEEEGA